MRRAWIAAAVCAATVGSAHADWTVNRSPFDATVAARYKQILARDPYDASALAALKTMYARYRTIQKLEGELGTDWASSVIKARLHPDAEHWRAVVAKKEDDARALFELAELERKPELYERALAATSDKALQRRCLDKLLAIAVDNFESDKADELFARLSSLRPTDPQVWLDRANAMTLLSRPDAAVEAFERAELLLATDPEKRLEATHGRATQLLNAGEADAAKAALELVIARAPATHHLAKQAWLDLITVHDQRGTLGELLTHVRRRFPHPNHFQWKLLAQIHDGLYHEDEALHAIKQAVAATPTESETQLDLIGRLEAAGKSEEALAQLEAATRAIPGDFQLSSDLATRYRERKDTPAAARVMQRVSLRLRNQASVHEQLVELFTQWDRPGLVVHELEELTRLEPETERLVQLGDAYWRVGNETKALATWKRVTEPLRLAQVYVEHEYWSAALDVYTRAIAKQPKNPALLRARADTYLVMQRWAHAETDARAAVALVAGKPMDIAHDVRYQLVRVLAQSQEHEAWDVDEEDTRLDRAMAEWNAAAAKSPPDIDALYMLAETLGRNAPTQELLIVLEKLRAIAPDDKGVVTALVRAYKVLHRYDAALTELRGLAKSHPERDDLADQIADLEKRKKAVASTSWDDGMPTDPEHMRERTRVDNSLAEFRAGMRIGMGSGLRGPSTQALVLGVYGAVRLSDAVAYVGRIDWTERAENMGSIKSIAVTSGVAMPVVTTSRATLLAGVGYRSELRVGDHAGWDTLGFAVDATLDIVPRKFPGALGLRFEQGLSDHARASSVLVEVSVGN